MTGFEPLALVVVSLLAGAIAHSLWIDGRQERMCQEHYEAGRREAEGQVYFLNN